MSLPPIIIFRRPLNHAHDFALTSFYDGLIINREDIFMTQEDEILKNAAATAEFRFGLIAPVIQGLFPDASATAYYKRIAQKEFTLPDGTVKKFSYKTIEDWNTRYKRHGLEGLMPAVRSDKGTSRALNDEAILQIFRIKEDFPRINATQIHQKLIQDNFIPATVSVDSVQRFIRNNDLKSARNPNLRDRKAFEEDSFGKMWQADTCYIAHITEDGVTRQVYCMAIIDDHSRMLVGAQMFYNDNALNFQKVLKDAIATYGCVPSKLLVDNGGPYANEQLSMICVSLGISLIHTKVRDGASKGKSERQWLSMKTTWIHTIDTRKIHSLDQFNEMLKDYVRKYNTSYHSGIDSAPMTRFQDTCKDVRHPLSHEWLDDCFYNRITRKVRNDATVSIFKESYDVPMQFIGMKVEIRFLPEDMNSAYILYEDTKSPIHKTNKIDNCHTKRNNRNPLDYSKIGGND